MQPSNIVVFSPVTEENDVQDAKELLETNPILVDFFWIEDAVKIEKLLEVRNLETFVQELNSYFNNNAEKEWSFEQVSEMFNELANIVLSKTWSLKRKIVRAIEVLTQNSAPDTKLIDIICQMKLYFETNIDREEKLTWRMIADINLEVTEIMLLG